MNLPPIIANLPFVKSFRSGSGQSSAPSSARTSAAPQDTVTISNAAQAKIQTGQARTLAANTRDELSQSPFSLGLNPEFS
jgi:hypothetical protein